MKHMIITAGLALSLTSPMAFASVENPELEECPIRLDFTMDDASDYWRTINDGVMGGLSSGGSRFKDGYMIFEGNINTNGGGFSSIRALMERGALTGTDHVRLKVRSDGRIYKVSLRTGLTYRGRSIAFQAPLPVTPVGEWTEISIPLTDLQGSIFGRPVKGAEFDKTDAREFGFILADGQNGPFRLDVEWVKAC